MLSLSRASRDYRDRRPLGTPTRQLPVLGQDVHDRNRRAMPPVPPFTHGIAAAQRALGVCASHPSDVAIVTRLDPAASARRCRRAPRRRRVVSCRVVEWRGGGVSRASTHAVSTPEPRTSTRSQHLLAFGGPLAGRWRASCRGIDTPSGAGPCLCLGTMPRWHCHGRKFRVAWEPPPGVREIRRPGDPASGRCGCLGEQAEEEAASGEEEAA